MNVSYYTPKIFSAQWNLQKIFQNCAGFFKKFTAEGIDAEKVSVYY